MIGGDRWSIVEGDALELLADLPGGSVDAIVTDPPYSSGGATRGDRIAQPSSKYSKRVESLPEFVGDGRDQMAVLLWSTLWLGAAWRAARPGAPIVCFSDWRMLPTFAAALQAGGWIWRGIVPWYKPVARPQIGRFSSSCEYALWGSRGPMPVERGVPVLPGLVSVDDVSDHQRAPVIVEANPVRADLRRHMTEKPVKVMRQLVRICVPGGLVVDPFAGAGSTGVAALAEGRRFLGMELAPDYCTIARDRLLEAAGAPMRDASQPTLDMGPR